MALRASDPSAPALVRLSQTEPWFHFVGRPDLHEAMGLHPNLLKIVFDGEYEKCVIPMIREENDERPAIAIIFSIFGRPSGEKFVLATTNLKSCMAIEFFLGADSVGGSLHRTQTYELVVQREEFRYMEAKSETEVTGYTYLPKLRRL